MLGGGQDDHLHVFLLRRQLPGRGDAIELWHRDVHQHDFRIQFACKLDGLAAVVRLTDHFVALGLQQTAKAVPKQRVIIGNQDSHAKSVIAVSSR